MRIVRFTNPDAALKAIVRFNGPAVDGVTRQVLCNYKYETPHAQPTSRTPYEEGPGGAAHIAPTGATPPSPSGGSGGGGGGGESAAWRLARTADRLVQPC